MAEGGRFYQAVLDHLEMPVEVIEIRNDDVTSATRAAWRMDKKNRLQLGHSLLRVAILKGSSVVRLMLGECLMRCMMALSLRSTLYVRSTLYTHSTRPPAPPSFAQYIQHTWFDLDEKRLRLLAHCSTAVINDDYRQPKQFSPTAGSGRQYLVCFQSCQTPFVQANADGITQVTVFTTACALMLAKETRSTDVVFGRVVSGRRVFAAEFPRYGWPLH